MHLDASAALARCGGNSAAAAAVTSEMVWQLETVVRRVLPRARAGAVDGSLQDRLVVAIHCGGVGPGRAARLAGALRSAATTVASNYPHRLYRCYLVDLPPAMALFTGAVLSLLPAATRAKVAACRKSAVPWPSAAAATVAGAERSGAAAML
eukprot:365123-Chlamydomonas_euryale.AAC.42